MANYPSSDPTIDSLHTAVNNLSTGLNGAIDAVQTTITVNDTSNFPAVGAITIDAERISYTSKNATQFLGCTRGFGNTTAVSHVDLTPVKQTYGAEYHNDARDEVIAVAEVLRNSFKAELDDSVTPASTASNLKQRLDHLVTQIKNILGLSDWKTAPTNDLDTLDSKLTNVSSNIPNLIANGGFEDWDFGTRFDDWSRPGPTANSWNATSNGTTEFYIERVTSPVETGRYSAHLNITNPGAGTTNVYLYQIIESPDYRNKTVTASVRMKTSTANKFRLRFFDGTALYYSNYHSGSDNWETLSVTIVVDSNSPNLTLHLGTINEAPSVSEVYIDSVQLRVGSEVFPYYPSPPNQVEETLRQNTVNKLINPGFEIWQRGTSFTTTANNAPLCDLWQINSSAVGSLAWTISRESSIKQLGQYSMKVQVTTAGTGTTRIVQYPENRAYNFAYKNVVFSARVWSDQPNAIRLGLFDGAVGVYSNYHSGNSTWETLTITQTWVNGNNQVWIMPEPTVVATHYVDDATLTFGSERVPYSPTLPTEDLANCQAYYQRIGGETAGEGICMLQSVGTDRANGYLQFTRMKSKPFATIVGTVSNYKLRDATSNPVNLTNITVQPKSSRHAYIVAYVAGGLVGGDATLLFTTNTTEYIEFYL
jgi:hypothetical protein